MLQGLGLGVRTVTGTQVDRKQLLCWVFCCSIIRAGVAPAVLYLGSGLCKYLCPCMPECDDYKPVTLQLPFKQAGFVQISVLQLSCVWAKGCWEQQTTASSAECLVLYKIHIVGTSE
jgi:hypothetical protein